MKKSFLLLWSLLMMIQGFSQRDTEFWFAVPEVTQFHGDRPIYLHLTSFSEEANVLISVPASNDFEPIEVMIPQNSLQSIDLTEFVDKLENTLTDSVVNKGMFIKSNVPITAYYEVKGQNSRSLSPNNTDVFVLKGANALGIEFFVPFQNSLDNNYNYYGNDGRSSVDIVATKNGTKVTITPTKDAVGHTEGVPFDIVLNKGQTYSLQAKGQLANDHMAGTRVQSNHPIAVTFKDDSILESVGSLWPSSDLIGDQLIPLRVAGTEYVLQSGVAYIVATKDSTRVKVGNRSDLLIESGDQIKVVLSDTVPVYIEATNKIIVLHTLSRNGEHGGAIVPPIRCTGSNEVAFRYDAEARFEVFLIVKKGGERAFEVNEKLIGNLNFKPVIGTNWMVYKGVLPNLLRGVNRVSNKEAVFLLGISNLAKEATFYGYFSDFGGMSLGADFSACQYDKVLLSAPEGFGSYTWSTGEKNNSLIVNTEIVQKQLFWLKVTNGACVFRDTISIIINESVVGINLPDLKQICEDEEYEIMLPAGYRYLWNTKDTTSILRLNESGEYSVSVKTLKGCEFKDTVVLEKIKTPIIELVRPKRLCKGEEIKYHFKPMKHTAYEWNNDFIGNEYLVTKPEKVVLKAITSIGDKVCAEQMDSVFIEYWEVKPFNIVTPNGDGKNEVFFIEGLKDGVWQLNVYNRWGNIMYSSADYKNDWFPIGVVDGVYFYDLKESKEASCTVYNGWIQILK